MCEHYYKMFVEKDHNYPGCVSVCVDCWKTKREIELEQQLTAANARVAELEQQKPSYQAEFDCVYEKLKAEEQLSAHYKQKKEQAEAQAAFILAAYCDECDADSEICRGTGPEIKCAARELDGTGPAKLLAENKRMRDALEELAYSTHLSEPWIRDIAKAALEVKQNG